MRRRFKQSQSQPFHLLICDTQVFFEPSSPSSLEEITQQLGSNGWGLGPPLPTVIDVHKPPPQAKKKLQPLVTLHPHPIPTPSHPLLSPIPQAPQQPIPYPNMADQPQPHPQTIAGGCLCGNVRYTIAFPDKADWPPGVSLFFRFCGV